ncbi:S9 family peptidase [Maridesulfovibrio salexigens]|uniref:Peptidase S9 prolyl oligopeptidase active site domain protein n=1 Tax=Maridesulfovibrio salexigens (strain ATCC 14822 / DSM 2638 / NCIMB 8403 / VKM B-1763) TaxID=526222 RepID=C6BXY0_MARSD|nr:S9 family peptidase [Maridesulfovibrio salexigens]ACS80510.1 peptidase S9 prolyl oligopeptidase active site domain protein [Maridesulfovibrio salexigens DSM 2638]
MIKPRFIVAVFAVALFLGLAACSTHKPVPAPAKTDLKLKTGQIPLRDFFKNPEAAGFTISPDGNKIAWLAPWKDRLNIFVKDLSSDKTTRVTSATQRDIYGYFWAGSERIVFGQDSGGDENVHTFSAAIDGSGEKDLTPFENTRTNLLDELEGDDDHILITINKDDPRLFDVYKLNIVTGDLKLEARNPGDVSGWMTDHNGTVRLAVASRNGQNVILYRKNANDLFRPIMSMDFRTAFAPLLFDFKNEKFYVSTNIDRDKQAIYLFDPATLKLEHLVFEHPDVDVVQLLYSKTRKVITGAGFYTDKHHYVFFDDKREEVQADLEAMLPGHEVIITDANKDESKCIVRTYSDRSLGAGYIYDIENKQLEKIAKVSPWFDQSKLAEMKPVSFTSRDGLTINGYLSLPKGKEAKNLPILINPHGGPWARDYWGFNPEVQFLTNRGIAVMQVNFRGSVGYGREFWEKGFKQWGLNMQNDLTDAVNWLIDQGIADPERVAIYGASYGGYATLGGLTFTPDLYACGIDYVGPSNLFTLLETLPPYWETEKEEFYIKVGDPVRDYKLLRKVSPVFHADKIKAPLFVAQGANDPRVKKAESDQIVKALRDRGVAVEYMVKDNEGHGFQNQENRFDFYEAMEKFLDEHLLQ